MSIFDKLNSDLVFTPITKKYFRDKGYRNLGEIFYKSYWGRISDHHHISFNISYNFRTHVGRLDIFNTVCHKEKIWFEEIFEKFIKDCENIVKDY